MGNIVNGGTKAPYGEKTATALVLSAGAPNAPLIAGAMHAAHEAGYRFPLIYASGGGIVIALLLIAPKGGDPLRALSGLADKLGVEDEIYRFLPLGYKTFFKGGPFTSQFREWSRQFKLGEPAPENSGRGALMKRLEGWIESALPEAKRDKAKRLYNDWVDLGTALATPTLLNPMSKGLCQPFPLIEELVDFEALEASNSTIYAPAYNLNTHEIQQFSNHPDPDNPERELNSKKLTPEAVRACLASPFIYPPVVIDKQPYIEGAYEEPYNQKAWQNAIQEGKIGTVLLLDILGSREMEVGLLRRPKSLWDAYGLSILTPIVAQAETVRKGIQAEHHSPPGAAACVPPGSEGNVQVMFPVVFTFPEGMELTEWRRSSLQKLFEIGKAAGEDAVFRSQADVQRRQPPPA